MPAEALAYGSIDQLSQRLATRTLSSRELVESCLHRIDSLNPRLNAFITVAADHARARADLADRELARGRRRSPLHGIPYAVKDVLSTRGIATTNGSRASATWRPEVDASVVARLDRAGGVLVGKLNLWEFAMTGGTFGNVKNPWDLRYSASGSSGGSAAAVAAGMVPFALGTDTGGSIRVPAAHCGVVGLRPTYGRVSRAGVTPNAWSIDTVGPLALAVADVAMTFKVISGVDPTDPTTRTGPVPRRAPSRWRIGLLRPAFDQVHPDVERAVMTALRVFERSGSRLVDVDVPHAHEAALARTLHLAEAAAFHENRLRDPNSGLGLEIRARLEEAQAYPAVAYIKALRLRSALVDETHRAFQRCDVLAMPTDRGLPLPLDQPGPATPRPTTGGPNTFLASMTGQPALSVPCGFSPSPTPLPVALMLQAPAHHDEWLFAMGAWFQRSTDWHLRHPQL